MELSALIARNADFAPDRAAIHFAGATLDYAAFAGRIGATARALKSMLGVGQGDRVAILSANHPDYLVLLYACARLGAILLPLNWRLAVAEQLFILQDAGIRLLVVSAEFSEVVDPLLAALPQCQVVGLDHVAAGGHGFAALLAAGSGDGANPHVDLSSPLLVVYTSGTTGRPKGAVLRQDALLCNGMMSQHMHAMNAADHVLTVLPMFHVGGLNIQTTPALHLGATVTLHARFAPDATLAAFACSRPSLAVLVPATIQALIDHPGWAGADLSSLRAITTGSNAVPPVLSDAIRARGVPVLQVYGATETCPVSIYTRINTASAAWDVAGLAGLLCEARVVDAAGTTVPPGQIGEIAIRGANVFTEYWGNPAATAEALQDGWYFTGDIGSQDAQGVFRIQDRKKNLIVSGGENIYPAEIERVLCDHPAVIEAAVVGRADPKWQEVPVAFVICRAGAGSTPPDAEALRAHLLGQLARFKVPREIFIVDDLPRTALGKVQHFRLRAMLAEGDASTT